MGKRLDYVDIAKGLGILLVIMGHVEYRYVPSCGSVHIPLFFILAGYLCDLERKNDISYGTCVGRRVKRLLIPYLIYNFLLWLKYILKIVVSHEFTVGLAAKSVAGFLYSAALFYKDVPSSENFEGFVFGNGPLWFLTAMAAASAVFYFVIYFVLRHRFDIKKILLSMVVLCVASWALCEYLPIYLPWSFEMALLGTIFMLIGLCLRHYKVADRIKKQFWLPIVCLVAFKLLHEVNGTANLALQDYGKYMPLYILLGLLSFLVGLFVSVWLEKWAPANKIFSYIGQNTLIILALHMTILSVFVGVVGKIGFAWLLEWGGFFVIKFLVALLGSLAVYEILTRFIKVPKKFL